MSNAIKFSNKASNIIVEAYAQGEFKYIKIQDFGIGMPESLINDIFLDHKKTTRTGTELEAGTGFGMPLAKFFIEQYGADIEVISKEKKSNNQDHGTTFTIIFHK